MCEAGGGREWRENKLLRENTILAVVTFPPELFYPIGVHTLGVVIRKGIPHPHGQKVLWARAVRDGFVKVKGKRLTSAREPNDFAELTILMQAFIRNPQFPIPNRPGVMKASRINFNDSLLELVPECYIGARSVSRREIEQAAGQLVREMTALAIRFPTWWGSA